MSRRVVAPVNLGCCHDTPRCVLCRAPADLPGPDLVEAMLAHYRDERMGPGDELFVGFYGGPPPSPELLEVLDDVPFTVRVRPDLLTRKGAADLAAAGVSSVEVEALTFDDLVLRKAGRHYRAGVVSQMCTGLTELGVAAGIVLAPGLPGSSFESCVADAERAAGLVQTARLHPVLVVEGSRLERWYREGLYEPLTLAQAVTVCRQMLDVLEAAGVKVIRIGVQPRPDAIGRAVAGPIHSSLRELVEARRVLQMLRGMLDGTPARANILVRCSPSDETRTRGPLNQHIRTLRAEFAARELRIVADPSLPRGEWSVEVHRE